MGATAVATASRGHDDSDDQPEKRGRGQPSKLSPQTVETLLGKLRLGHTHDDAARYAGIHPATFQRWLQRGRNATKGEYRDFCDRVELAIIEGKDRLIKVLQLHAPRKPELALKMLARRWPKEWGPKASLEIEQKETPDVEKAMEVIEQRLAAMEERKRLAAEVIETVTGLRQIADSFGEPQP